MEKEMDKTVQQESLGPCERECNGHPIDDRCMDSVVGGSNPFIGVPKGSNEDINQDLFDQG